MNDDDPRVAYEKLRSALIMLCFGLGILAFLIAIDKREWFRLRPASGVAAALHEAGSVATRSEPKSL